MFLCPVLGLQAHAVFAALSGFYVNAGDLYSDPHTCVADILPTEPLHQPQVPVKPQYCLSKGETQSHRESRKTTHILTLRSFKKVFTEHFLCRVQYGAPGLRLG